MFRRFRSCPITHLSSPANAGDPVFQRRRGPIEKPRRAGSPAFAGGDGWVIALPAKPFRLTRQFDGLDLLELDRTLADQIVEIAIGRAGYLRAIEVDLERAAMVLIGPGRGIADAFHAGRDPILL